MSNFYSIKAYAGWGPRSHRSRMAARREAPWCWATTGAGFDRPSVSMSHWIIVQKGEWKKGYHNRDGGNEKIDEGDMGGKIKPTPGVKPQSDRFLSWKRRLNPPIHPSVPHSLIKPAAWRSCRGTRVPWQQGFCGPYGNPVMRLI